MSEKSNTIAALEAARGETLAAIDGIPEEKMLAPAFGTWSVKDVLCHLTSWGQFAVLDLWRVSRGHVPQLATFRSEEIDDWNAWLMRSRSLFPLPQVMLELHESWREFIAALNALPDEMFAAGQLPRLVADELCNGDRVHGTEISEWRQKEGV